MATSQTTSAALGAENLFNVKGLVAVVTGGGTGIGLMITKALAVNGASKVYILGRRLEILQKAAAEIGSNVIPIATDVTSKESLQSAVDHVKQDVGFVNLLICNSGIGGPYGSRPKKETTLDEFVEANLSVPIEDYTNTFNVNTSAVWYTTMSFLKLLDAGNKQGNVEQMSHVIAISSIGALNKINTGGFAYGQSKAACLHLVKHLSVVLPQWNIRANAICPGLYPSEMSAPILARGGLGKDQIPLERPGDEKDLGGTILYLASRAGAYNNGAVIVTDGGRLTTFPSTF
ncbi:NAD(P)-binding protein [Annulohypoxylon maeteangense]|uniref:NAD(P)-binding protein n=1 Tax=Annulohypoxylon maeteangense TaxID=1927788 RepID=UPI002008D662|nr:NAD(P)-binding protein [Annulohypoxylon maeteangense]KAI0888284.1 NAD(P)-binding protein [Annulohypoxylon maeteangense]